VSPFFGLALYALHAVASIELPTRGRIITNAIKQKFSVTVLPKRKTAAETNVILKFQRAATADLIVDQHIDLFHTSTGESAA
jgi:hypothetical protein